MWARTLAACCLCWGGGHARLTSGIGCCLRNCCSPGVAGPANQPTNQPPISCCQVYVRRVRKYLGGYFMHLGGKVDAIVFSAGGCWAPLLLVGMPASLARWTLSSRQAQCGSAHYSLNLNTLLTIHRHRREQRSHAP